MAIDPVERVFSAQEAGEVAHLVVDHTPEFRREVAFVPRDEAAANAGVLALVECLEGLPGSIRSALKRAGDSAAFLSDDRLQGLAELIQNADDLGATEAVIAIDGAGSRLLFSHNGAPLTLHDVWALAIPWLSLKVSDEEKLGRFGIGLKTLHALSDVLEVNQGHFQVRFSSNTIQPQEHSIGWSESDITQTTFAIPFTSGSVSSDDAVRWLRRWDDAGLVFLRHLSTVRVVNENGNELVKVQLHSGDEEVLPLAGDRTTRRRVSASDGRQWLVYGRSAPSPEDVGRVGKVHGARTPLAYAFALFEGDTGHIHVGLPVREVGLPFRMLAQFDPQPSRRDIADTDWNLALIPLLADLWRDAILDLFRHAPTRAWTSVPTTTEFNADGKTTSRLRVRLEEHLLRRARVEFAESLTLDDNGHTYRLNELAYEAAELTSVLRRADIQLLSERPGVLISDVRSDGTRWREVLADLRDIGGTTPTQVTVEDAGILLDDDQRSPQFIADLLGVLIEAGLHGALGSRNCLVLDDGNRVSPSSRIGTSVLLPAGPNPLWNLLGIGTRLHPTFVSHPLWGVIRDWLEVGKWLRPSATSTDALAVLASAGSVGTVLDMPLSDAQIEGMRRTLETVPEADRQALGAGIGRAVRVGVVSYAASGDQVKTYARPCETYFIERDASTWFVAAGKTPGLVWIDRRYSERMRSDLGRDGIGAQKLFRLLGSEVAPRVVSHPGNYRRLSNYSPGVPDSAPGSPSRRRDDLRHLQASFTLQDWISPDLDAVLSSIANEKDASHRRRRAGAVLGTLTRAWERLSEHSTVTAASPYHRWEHKGTIDAWWVSSAASIAWLPSEKGNATTPHELRIKSSATVALYGDDPERYLSPVLDTEAYREVLARLGVAGDPSARELIHKLEEVRAEGATSHSAEDLAAPLYQALSVQVRGNRLGGMLAGTARNAFGRGDGLIATRSGWRRPSVVLAGPPIFGEMRDFVPSVSGTDALWSLLGIQLPDGHEARSILTDLARRRRLASDEKLIMLEALRLLVGTPEAEPSRLRKAAVWVGDRWERGRPVYATENVLIAQGLKGRVPMWSPGGSLTQLSSLVDAYHLTRLDSPHGQVLDPGVATYDANLTQVFATAVTNLRSDLALSDPKTEASLRVSWDELAALRIEQTPHLRVRVVEPAHSLDETIEVGSWLDLSAGTFYICDEAAIGSPSSGAYAIASVFDGDARRIAHDWVAAWSMALEGHREEEITTATRLDAERKQSRDERSEELLRSLAEQGKNRRSKSDGRSDTKGRRRPSANVITDTKPTPTRRLVDPESLTLKNEDGEIVGRAPIDSVVDIAAATRSSSGKPREPDPLNPKKPSNSGGRGTKNYSAQERETVGLDLVRRVLGGDEAGIVDIRHQRNVGADAIDDLENFFELKVYAGPIPETISLTNSEYRRAKETEQFFLVVVGNVEQSDKSTEIRIFTDPLNHLKPFPQGSVNLSGVRDARALRYTFES